MKHADPVRAVLALDSWAGRTEHPVEIVGETPKRYRVRILEDWLILPSKRVAERGDVVLVPKYAVRVLRGGEEGPKTAPDPTRRCDGGTPHG